MANAINPRNDFSDIKAQNDWLKNIEEQMDDTVPYYVPHLISEIRLLEEENARLLKTVIDLRDGLVALKETFDAYSR